MNAVLDSIVRQAVERYHVPGLAAVISCKGEEKFAAGSGFCDAAGRCPIDGDTKFGVASVTKLMTAIAVARLADDRRLSIFDQVRQYLPRLRFSANAPVQLSHLLSHSSGLPGLPSRYYALNLADPTDELGGLQGSLAPHIEGLGPIQRGIVSVNELIDLLNNLAIRPLAAPGALLNYSNEGFCLVGGILEHVASTSFRCLLRRLVTEPLHMDRTDVGEAGLDIDSNLAVPMLRDGEHFRPSRIWDAPLFYPAGGAISTARDLVRLVETLGVDSPILSPGSRSLITSPRMAVASRPDSRFAYGLGIEYMRISPSNTLLWHSGQRAGVSSFVGYLPERQIAASVLCNVADVPVAMIGHKLLTCFADLDSLDLASSKNSLDWDGMDRCQFQGEYVSMERFAFSVDVRDGRLFLTGQGQSFPFVFFGWDYGTVGHQTFRFLGADDFEPWALSLDLRIFERNGVNHSLAI